MQKNKVELKKNALLLNIFIYNDLTSHTYYTRKGCIAFLCGTCYVIIYNARYVH